MQDILWQAQAWLVQFGWQIGQAWDSIGGWTGAMQWLLVGVLFGAVGAVIGWGIYEWRHAPLVEEPQPEGEQPRVDTGALLLAQMAVEASQAIEPSEDEAGEDFETYFLSFNAQQPDVKFTRKQALAMYYRLPLYAEWRDAERSGIGTVLASDFIPWFEAPKQEERGEQS